MGVSSNGGTPKSSILIGFSIINHPFWGFPPIFGNTHIVKLQRPETRPIFFPEGDICSFLEGKWDPLKFRELAKVGEIL